MREFRRGVKFGADPAAAVTAARLAAPGTRVEWRAEAVLRTKVPRAGRAGVRGGGGGAGEAAWLLCVSCRPTYPSTGHSY